MVVRIEPVYHRNVLFCGHSCMFVPNEPVYHKQTKKTAVLWTQLYVRMYWTCISRILFVCTYWTRVTQRTCCSMDTVVCLYVLSVFITYICTYWTRVSRIFVHIEPVYHVCLYVLNLFITYICTHWTRVSRMFVRIEPVYHKKHIVLWTRLYICTYWTHVL
jgi:hypothetical protein